MPGRRSRHPATNYFSSLTVASISISSSVKISVVFWKVVIASFFTRAHFARLFVGFRFDVIHQQPDRQHRVLLSMPVSAGSSSLNTHEGFDGGELHALACNIEVLTFRDHLHRIGGKAFVIGGWLKVTAASFLIRSGLATLIT